jgi:hypothetical protein
MFQCSHAIFILPQQRLFFIATFQDSAPKMVASEDSIFTPLRVCSCCVATLGIDPLALCTLKHQTTPYQLTIACFKPSLESSFEYRTSTGLLSIQLQYQVLLVHLKQQHMVCLLTLSSPLHLKLLEGTQHSVQRPDMASCIRTPLYLDEDLVAASG